MNREFAILSAKLRKLSLVVYWLILDWLLAPSKRILCSSCDWDETSTRFAPWFKYQISFKDFATVASFDTYDIVIPISSDAYLALPEFLKCDPRLVSPNESTFHLCNDKRRLFDQLIELGYRDLLPIFTENEFPCLLKPLKNFNSNGVQLIENEAQLEQLRGRDDFHEHMLQAYIPGEVELASHILIRKGKIRHAWAIEYSFSEEHPINIQNCPKLRRIVRDPFLYIWEELLNRIDFDGICCIDYKPFQGRPKLLEINPRIGGSFREYAFSFFRYL